MIANVDLSIYGQLIFRFRNTTTIVKIFSTPTLKPSHEPLTEKQDTTLGSVSLCIFIFLFGILFIYWGEGPQGHRIKPLITQ